MWLLRRSRIRRTVECPVSPLSFGDRDDAPRYLPPRIDRSRAVVFRLDGAAVGGRCVPDVEHVDRREYDEDVRRVGDRWPGVLRSDRYEGRTRPGEDCSARWRNHAQT